MDEKTAESVQLRCQVDQLTEQVAEERNDKAAVSSQLQERIEQLSQQVFHVSSDKDALAATAQVTRKALIDCNYPLLRRSLPCFTLLKRSNRELWETCVTLQRSGPPYSLQFSPIV